MVRIEAEVDRDRRELLRTSLLDTNTKASPVLRALREDPDGSREVPLHVWALNDDNATDGTLIGGLVGHTWAGWLHVTYLWVHARHRHAGLGGTLLARAEHIARAERGCGAGRLETWDFQAPAFYRARGWEIVCAIPDYPPGVTEFTLTKRLG